MAKWFGVVLVGLLAAATTLAQQPPTGYPGPLSVPQFAGEPIPIQQPQFCPPPAAPAASPVSLPDDRAPNAFVEDCACPPKPTCLWLSYECLFWQPRSDHVSPTLVTTSTAPDLTTNFGAIDQANTVSLFGHQTLRYGVLQGNRLTLGIGGGMFPQGEISGFWFNRQDSFFNLSSSAAANAPVLARPVFATQLANQQGLGQGQEVAFLSGFPNAVAGNVHVQGSFNLWDLEANAIFPMTNSAHAFVELLLGYRHMDLNEGLSISSSSQLVDPSLVLPYTGNFLGPGNTIYVSDNFRTRNQFNGAQFGARTGFNFGPILLMLDTKANVGGNQQILNVNGSTSMTSPGLRNLNSTSAPGGILAVGSNSGQFVKNDVAFVGEVGTYLGWQVVRWFRVYGGYDFIYWSSVVRPGRQLSNLVDTRQVPTDPDYSANIQGTNPTPRFETSSFWIQGFQFGVMFTF